MKEDLTSFQQGLWFDFIIKPTEIKYNVPYLFELCGNVDVNLFIDACNYVVDRHEGLRTYFSEDKRIPKQHMFSRKTDSLQVLDFSEKPDNIRQQDLLEFVSQTICKPFDLCSPPLFYSYLIKISSDKYYWLLSFHHIIIDGHSLHLFFSDFSEYYNNKGDGLLKQRNKVDIRAFVEYENKLKAKSLWGEAKHYWKDFLAESDQKLNWFESKNRSLDVSNAGKRACFALSVDLSRKIDAFVSEHREVASLFKLLSGVFSILIYRVFQKNDVIFGYASGKRPKEYQGLFGFMVN